LEVEVELAFEVSIASVASVEVKIDPSGVALASFQVAWVPFLAA
jgi:hypothetical protein